MSITVNTNMSALRIQQNLSSATSKMNTAMERMSSGSKINAAKDDAAGYAVSKTLSTTLSIDEVAKDNVAMGQDLLSAGDGVLSVISENLTRIADLLTQAANGTYSNDDVKAIQAEIQARGAEVNSLKATTFNGISLFGGSTVRIQTGQTGYTDATHTGDTVDISDGVKAPTITDFSGLDITGGTAAENAAAITTALGNATTALGNVTTQSTQIGALQNKLDAVNDALTVQTTNLTSAVSTIKDADVAEESANYVQAQILQSASATLLVQANSAPQIALTLIKG